jgi:hypothetical protein
LLGAKPAISAGGNRFSHRKTDVHPQPLTLTAQPSPNQIK